MRGNQKGDVAVDNHKGKNPYAVSGGSKTRKPKTFPADAAYGVYDTALGPITIAASGSAIIALEFGREVPCAFQEQRNELTDRAAAELDEYLSGKRKYFDLPLAPQGTPFQLRVWDALCKIPFGQTRTYGEIAKAVGNPAACRAVGMANNRNPIAIMIPCHRVIGAGGSLTGYAGGLDIKEKLLRLEGSIRPDGEHC